MKRKHCAYTSILAILTICGSFSIASVSYAKRPAVLDIPLVPNSGTPEATEALMKSIPPLEAGGFQLGMSAKDAFALMKSKGMMVDPNDAWNRSFQLTDIPGQNILNGGHAAKDGESGREDVWVSFTPYPTPPVVTVIMRSHGYPYDKAATLTTVVDALRNKYGKEMFEAQFLGNETLYWFYDYKGHPLTNVLNNKQKLVQFQRQCLRADAGIMGFEQGMNKLTTNHYSLYPVQSRQKQTSTCFDTIRIKAVISTTDPRTHGSDVHVPWDKKADHLVTGLTVSISDLALDYSANRLTLNLAMHNQQLKQQKALDAAKQRKAPSL